MISIGRYIACLILFAFSFLKNRAQDFDALVKAMTAAEEKRQFQQAIGYIQKIIAIDTIKERRPYRYWRIANLYDSLGNKEQSKAYCRLAVTDGKFDYSYFKRRYAVTLADRFINEKSYDSALYYLKYVRTIPSIRNMCGSNGIYSRTDFNYRLMLAYEGLNEIDSAINCFLPYAFEEWTDNYGVECSTQHLLEGDYHCQVLDFLKVLRKKYSQAEITDQVNNIIATVSVKSRKENYNNYCSLYCDFSITFFEHELQLDFLGTSCPATVAEENNTINFYKELFIHDLRQSLIYLINSPANYL
jgi:tetratricopeptide (TPR) repeat protein